MRKEYQLITGKGGDCLRASIASILAVPTKMLPHFSSKDGDQIDKWNEYLKPANLKLEMVGTPPYEYYIAGVAQGEMVHACVGKGRGIVHDPHPMATPPYEGDIRFCMEINRIDKKLPQDVQALFVTDAAIDEALAEVRAEYGESIGPEEAYRLARDMVKERVSLEMEAQGEQ